MHRYWTLIYDVACMVGALFFALYLHDGHIVTGEGEPARPMIISLISSGFAIAVLLLFQTHKNLWAYLSFKDLGLVFVAVTTSIILMNACFYFILHYGVIPRSVLPLHWALAIVAMTGARLLVRQLSRPVVSGDSMAQKHVIVVGVGHTAELYMQFARKVMPNKVVIEGVVDENEALVKRYFHGCMILGTFDALPKILEQYRLHGVRIDQFIIAKPWQTLSQHSQEYLETLKRQYSIEIVHFDRQIGMEERCPEQERIQDSMEQSAPYIAIEGFYPKLKRAYDIGAALILLVACMPLMLLTALLVAVDIGMPVIFWQRRPGRYGKPFKLYKFRTMRPVRHRWYESRAMHKSRDHMRCSGVGRWIRRMRLDELPQLWNILRGDMSFIGPRPLLEDDQPEGGQARLSIRPGVSGWAQVHGGDALTADQKLIMDLWYIQHMSVFLDVRILIKTVLVVIHGDKPKLEIIEKSRTMLHGSHMESSPVRVAVSTMR